jgi:hypothetical protein
MKIAIQIAALTAASLALSACGTPDSGYSDKSSGSRQATSAAESACMAAVNRQYGGKYDVKVVRSEYSEANSLVVVAGGPDRERWRCLASNGGVVQELTPAQGKPAATGQSGYGDLVGMRAGSLDAEMASRGFKSAGGYQASGAVVSTWWNAGSRECLSVETRQGRVAKAETVPGGNCR